MAKTSLNFNKEGNIYKATFVSSGNSVVQIKRLSNSQGQLGYLQVYANIDGMDPILLASWNRFSSSENLMFQVDIMAGVTITLISEYEVESANVLTE